MKQQQAGFTLIELIMVIVILGILAATALPKFIDLQGDANRGVTEGVAGALSSASAMNYAACLIHDHDQTKPTCTAVADCAAITPLAEGVAFGTSKGQYSVTGSVGATNGLSGDCTVGYCTADDACSTITATFRGIRAGTTP